MVDDDFFLLFKISESPVLMKFLHECVDDFVEKRKANFDNYNSSDIEWMKTDYDKARKSVQKLFCQNVAESLDLKSLKLGENLEKAISNCFEARKNDIFQALAMDAILKNGNHLVENIDWKLKWVLGSSDLAAIRTPLLQIQLHCNEIEGEKIEKNSIEFEANIEQIDHFIKDLTDIQTQFQEQISTKGLISVFSSK